MNRKGFTMVELLVTIIILGLLTTLVITSIASILDKSHEEYYNSQENMLVLAGRDYFADYRSKLPKEVGETSSVTVETLINEKYIDPVKDRNENNCNFKKSNVTVQKITDKDYQYYVTLICDADNYETTEDRADPVIKYTPNKKSSTKSITVKMSVTDDKGVASFRYVITKDDEVIKDSGYQIYTGEIKETFTELGIYRIEGYAIDVSGNSSVKESGIYSVYKGINCAEVDYSSSTKVETWVNKNITVNVKVPSNTYRYEISTKKDNGSYTLLNSYIGNGNQRVRFDSNGKYQIKVTLYDNDGNTCSLSSDGYYIDKTAPTCNTTGAPSSWTNKDVTLKGTCSDTGGSGCKGNASKKIDSNTNGKVSPGKVYDKAGNSVTCPSVTVKIDKTKPTCKSSGGNSNWTNGNRTITGKCSDKGGSGCKGNVSKTISSNTNGSVSPGKVYDNAGNSATCSGVTVKIDKTKPTCKSSGGNSNWTNGNRTITGKCSDTGGSGCKGNVSKTIKTNTNGGVSPGTVYDKAGNSAVCPNQTVKIDKTAPTCTSSGGSNAWTTGSRTLVGTCSDTGGSGCKGNVSWFINWPGEWYNLSPGTVYDNAGNSRACPANQTVKITSMPTKPTIDLHGYKSGSWTNQDVTITASSTSTVGIDRYQHQVGNNYWNNNMNDDPVGWNRQFNNDRTSVTIKIGWESSYSYSIRAIDKLGNAGPGSDFFSVNIDKTPPTLTATFTNAKSGTPYQSGTWTNEQVIRRLYPDDAGGSGIKEVQYNDGNGWHTEKYWQEWTLSDMNRVSKYRVIDNAGNISNEIEIHYMINTSCSESNPYGCPVLYACKSAGPQSFIRGTTWIHANPTLSLNGQVAAVIYTGGKVYKLGEATTSGGTEMYHVYVDEGTEMGSTGQWNISFPGRRTGYIAKGCLWTTQPSETNGWCWSDECKG